YDGGMWPRDKGAIVAMQINKCATECVAPIRNRAIIMVRRASNRLQAPERADIFHRLTRNQRDAIPHHAAIALTHQQCALPDRKSGFDSYSGDAEIVAPDQLVTLRQLLTRDPLLAFPVHILPLVLANRARSRGRGAFGKLGTALFASPERHRHRSNPAKKQPAKKDGLFIDVANYLSRRS